jgi:hypothetical protein
MANPEAANVDPSRDVKTDQRPRPRLVFWVAFLSLFLAIGAWSVANPRMASPDEPAHAVKAAATVRGEFAADESKYNPGRGDFDVPKLFSEVWSLTCYAFHPDTTAKCITPFSGDLNAPSTSTSHVDRYNPLYYAIIGLPSLLPLSGATLVLMRLMSALVTSFLLALTVRTVAELRRPNWPLAGIAAAVTPMTVYIASTMTPQGTEIFGAILTLTILLSLLYEPDPGLTSKRMWRLVIGVGFFVMARGLSPLYLAFAVALVVFIAPRWSTVWDIVKNRKIWPQLAACVALSVAAVIYIVAANSLALGIVLPDPSLTPRLVVRTMVNNTDYYVEQFLGVFGWGDTHLSLSLQLLIGGVVVAVGVVGVAFARWRERAGLAVVVLATFLTPIALQLVSYKESGIVWQGKYILPIAIAFPLLAGFVIERHPMSQAVSARIVPILIAAAAVGQIAAFAENLHRYVNGANGPWFSFGADAWMPSGSVWAAAGVELIAWLAIVVLVRRFFVSRSAPDSLSPLQLQRTI